jgi:hypothetical protein
MDTLYAILAVLITLGVQFGLYWLIFDIIIPKCGGDNVWPF